MSASAHFDLSARASTTLPADGLTWPIVEEAEPAWVCSFCGRLRVYEGGRAFGPSDRNDCRECGCRLADVSENLPAIATRDGRRGRVRILIERDLF